MGELGAEYYCVSQLDLRPHGHWGVQLSLRQRLCAVIARPNKVAGVQVPRGQPHADAIAHRHMSSGSLVWHTVSNQVIRLSQCVKTTAHRQPIVMLDQRT
jgi:hypothetical protein